MLTAARRGLAGIAIIVGALVSTTAFAVPAHAASPGQAWVSEDDIVVFSAAKRATNSVTITRSGRAITIDDKVAITAYEGCRRVGKDKTKVKCTTSQAPEEIDVWLEDKNDILTNKTNVYVYVDGGGGNDKITGGKADDVLRGGSGNDTLRGGLGRDILIGGTGADVMTGDAGVDLVSYYDRKKAVKADVDGAKRDDGEKGEKDTISADVERLEGGKGADTLTGNGMANFLLGGAGNDVLRGGGGVDVLLGDKGADTMFGGGGRDMVSYYGRTKAVKADLDGVKGDDGEKGEKDTISVDVEDLEGGKGADTLTGNGKENFLRGGAGNDVLAGGGGYDAIMGEQGADSMSGGAGVDLVSYVSHQYGVIADLDGEMGDDGEWGEGDSIALDVERLAGGEGNDTLTGNADDNVLWGGAGSDTINGDGGSDYLDGEAGGDTLSGGDGTDAVTYYLRSKPITADLDNAFGDDGETNEGDTISDDVEGLEGGKGADKLTGNDAANIIWGGAGNDEIRGGAGDDKLEGSNGTDKIYGEAGDDDLVAEPGTVPAPGDLPGSDTAKDAVDGGDNTPVGDGCSVRAAGTVINCERAVALPSAAQFSRRSAALSRKVVQAGPAGAVVGAAVGLSGSGASGIVIDRTAARPR